MNAASDKATAGREMLTALRLLAIQGHLPNGRETIERWEAALDHGEPGLGRVAAVRALLDGFSGSSWEVGETRNLIERIEQVANGSRTESCITEADGSAYLTPGDLSVVLDALDVAGDELRCRAGICNDCDVTPAGLCATCESRMDRADEYDALAARLGGAS